MKTNYQNASRTICGIFILVVICLLANTDIAYSQVTQIVKKDPKINKSDLVAHRKEFLFSASNPDSILGKSLWKAFFVNSIRKGIVTPKLTTARVVLPYESSGNIVIVNNAISRVGNSIKHSFVSTEGTTDLLFFSASVKKADSLAVNKLMAYQSGAKTAFEVLDPAEFSFSEIKGLSVCKETGAVYFFADLNTGTGYQSLYMTFGGGAYLVSGTDIADAQRGEGSRFTYSQHIYPTSNNVFFSGYVHTSANPSSSNFSDWKEVLWQSEGPVRSPLFTGFNQYIVPERFAESFTFNNSLIFSARTSPSTLPQYFIKDELGEVRPLIKAGTTVVMAGRSIPLSPFGVRKVFAVNGNLVADLNGMLINVDPSTGIGTLFSQGAISSISKIWANIIYLNGYYYGLAALRSVADPLKDSSAELYQITNSGAKLMTRGNVLAENIFYRITHPEDIYGVQRRDKSYSISTHRHESALSYTVY